MASIDYITGPYDAIWALLEGSADWAAKVKAGNRIKWDRVRPQKEGRGESDFPEAELRPGRLAHGLGGHNAGGHGGAGEAAYAVAAQPPTFGGCGWIDEVVQEYVLILTFADLRLALADGLKLATLAALRGGLPRLGLAYVSEVGPITAADQETPDGQGPTRLVTTFHIPVRMRFTEPQ